ncbi:DUF1549 domain-containing protein [Schlesneria sp.]|uniref:DUF1549 domain-containing protein n=1 Tax=Schlesneria sp. TaxID=2762018 RepID=UPI002F06BE5C
MRSQTMDRVRCGSAVLWCVAILISRVAVCLSAEHVEQVESRTRIDEVVETGCHAEGISPLPTCSDTEFLRRVWLDLAGRTPPLEEVLKVTSSSLLDRGDVIERLVKSPEFARHWGRIWAEYLTEQRPFETEGYDGRRLLQFLTKAFHEDQPYTEIVSELILGEGTSDVSGATNFLMRYNAEPIPLAGAVSQKFLGLSMHCAECHDHPHARWKQKDFLGLAAHFARLRKMTPTNPQEGESFFVIIERPRGELRVADRKASPNENGQQPLRTIFPQLPDSPRTDSTRARRAVLVEWLTENSNPYLGRHMVNLVWERLLGERLVPSLDDWPPQNLSPNTELLNLLAADFCDSGWSIQQLVTTIAKSRTYQRSSHNDVSADSRFDPEKAHTERANWSRARIRPLSADQIHLSIGQAFGYHFDENDHRLAHVTGEEFSQDIPNNNLGAIPLSLSRSLALYNSDYVRGAVDLGSEVAIRLYGPHVSSEHIERMFLVLLSRRPTIEEIEFFQDQSSEDDPRTGLQDILWVLLNSSEFVTNH